MLCFKGKIQQLQAYIVSLKTYDYIHALFQFGIGLWI